MKRIMLVCAGGMSTSLLMNKMNAAAKARGIEVEIWATSQGDAKNHYDRCDIVLVGPQIRFAIPKMKEELTGRAPIQGIEMADYGCMNGEKILTIALEIMDAFEASK